MNISPLLSHSANYTQNTGGSPYLYIGLDSIVLKYVNILFSYDYVRLKYKVIDFASSLNWINPERIVTIHSFNIETSLLISIGNIKAQIGYGYTFNSTQLDDKSSVTENRHYFILAAKKSDF